MLSLICLKNLNAATYPLTHSLTNIHKTVPMPYMYIYRTEESNILRSCDFICAKYLIRKFSYFFLPFPISFKCMNYGNRFWVHWQEKWKQLHFKKTQTTAPAPPSAHKWQTPTVTWKIPNFTMNMFSSVFFSQHTFALDKMIKLNIYLIWCSKKISHHIFWWISHHIF